WRWFAYVRLLGHSEKVLNRRKNHRGNSMSVTLTQASSIVDATLKKARELKQMPQTVVVLDAGGHIVCAKREDGSGIIRFEVAVVMPGHLGPASGPARV